MSKKIVIALGGNALGKTPEEQLKLVKNTAKSIVELIKEGHEIVVTHGNGPQVGMINLAMEYSSNNNGTSVMPFAECGAMSQGYIGYHLQQSLLEELEKNNIEKNCLTVVTQVLVDKNDHAFKNPTKPIGSFYTKEEALKISEANNYEFKEDAGRGYRRVVPSPMPLKVLELKVIKELIDHHNVVIACGGGGIPVIKTEAGYQGVDAVIDKDMTSARLATEINADILLILTAVDKVSIHFNQENEEKLSELTVEEAKKYIADNEFAKGSMLPKIEACLQFVTETNGKAIITSLENAKDALQGLTGTVIKK